MCSMAGRAGRNLPVFAEAENREPFPKRKDFGFDAGKLTWQDAVVLLLLPRSVSLFTEHG